MDYFESLRQAQWNLKDLCKSEAKGSEWCNVVRIRPALSGFEGGRGGHEIRNVDNLEKLERAGNRFTPRASRKEQRPAKALMFA